MPKAWCSSIWSIVWCAGCCPDSSRTASSPALIAPASFVRRWNGSSFYAGALYGPAASRLHERRSSSGARMTLARLRPDWKPCEMNRDSSRRTRRCSRWAAPRLRHRGRRLAPAARTRSRVPAAGHATRRASGAGTALAQLVDTEPQVESRANIGAFGSSRKAPGTATSSAKTSGTPSRSSAVATTSLSSVGSMPTRLRAWSSSRLSWPSSRRAVRDDVPRHRPISRRARRARPSSCSASMSRASASASAS